MKSALLRWGLTAGLMLAVSASPVLAQGRGNGKERERGVDAQASVHVQKGDHDRSLAGTHGLQGRPPGWDRGRKTGWGNCDVPPGQAKKYGCRNVRSRRRTGVHATGSIVVHHSTSGRGTTHPARADRENPR